MKTGCSSQSSSVELHRFHTHLISTWGVTGHMTAAATKPTKLTLACRHRTRLAQRGRQWARRHIRAKTWWVWKISEDVLLSRSNDVTQVWRTAALWSWTEFFPSMRVKITKTNMSKYFSLLLKYFWTYLVRDASLRSLAETFLWASVMQLYLADR